MNNKKRGIIVGAIVVVVLIISICIIRVVTNKNNGNSATRGEVNTEIIVSSSKEESSTVKMTSNETTTQEEIAKETTTQEPNLQETSVQETTTHRATEKITEMQKNMYVISSANVRTGADYSYGVKGKLSKNTKVLVTGMSGEWYRIIYNDGEGFVHYSLLTESESTPEKDEVVEAGGENTSNQPAETKSEEPTFNRPVIDKSGYVDEVIRLVNVERAKYNLSPLVKSTQLCGAAQIRVKETVELFSHTRPNGQDCFSILDENNINWTAVGENIAAGQPTPQDVVDCWMNSQGHRENILGSDFGHIGVGFLDGQEKYGEFWVQIFTD